MNCEFFNSEHYLKAPDGRRAGTATTDSALWKPVACG